MRAIRLAAAAASQLAAGWEILGEPLSRREAVLLPLSLSLPAARAIRGLE